MPPPGCARASGEPGSDSQSGRRASFAGEDVSDILVAVFRDDPDWSALPKETPPRILQAMRVCLRKEAKVRDIAAVRLAMEGAFETHGSTAAPAKPSLVRRALPALVVALAAALGGLVVWSVMRRTPAELAVFRTSIFLPQTQRRTNTGRRGVAVSPNGTHVAYIANEQLYLRAMDALEARPLAGTEGSAPTLPFFSPDGQWLGFYSTRDNQLEKVALTGGAVVTLCETGNPYGASWGADDTIVFGQGGRGIFQVSAAGGTPELLLPVETKSGERAHGPQILPDGRTALFTVAQENWNEAQIVVQSLPTGERRVLLEGGTDARYVPTGHLVYALAGNLLAVPFDLDRLEILGGPVPLVEDVSETGASGGANFDISRNGTLVYLPGGSVQRELVWVDREGREARIAAEPRSYVRARISPAGRHPCGPRGAR